jgi:hypothetical protein
MPMDFPAAPGSGEIYTSPEGITYVFDATDGVWRRAVALSVVATATIGDVKSGFQPVDHGGWILLDGRAITDLTATQQIEAIALGFAANLPNAEQCSLRQGTSTSTLGGLSGTSKISQDNLPAMTSNSAGDHAHMTQGNHNQDQEDNLEWQDANRSQPLGFQMTSKGIWYQGGSYWDNKIMLNAGAHTHTTGGSNSDYWIKAIIANFFVYLGA